MQVIIKNKRFHINLPSRLFSKLKEFNKLHERMDFDLAVLILHFILKQQSEPQEWVPLSSVVLRRYDHGRYKSSEQVELLKEGGFIEYLNHQNDIPGKENSSRKFRVSLQYFEQGEIQVSDENIYHTYDLKQKPLLKKLEKHNRLKRIEADSTTPHLTKWLKSERFTIEAQAALEYIEKYYCKDSYKYLKRLEKIKNFDPSQSFSRSGRDDRLHSIFTQIPSDLKKFIQYEGQPLIEVDIKSSQPLMFSILLERILNHYFELKESKYGVTKTRLRKRIYKTLKEYINNGDTDYYNNSKYVIDINKISIYITIILLETFKPSNFTDVRNFISLVRSGAFYEYLGQLVLTSGEVKMEKNNFSTYLFNRAKEIQEKFTFNTLRDCSKKLLINALYSPKGKGKVTAINKVKDLFSSVFLIVDAFKINKHKDLSLVLQRMEAKFVLDYCAKKISHKFPDMPLVARHDSLSTIEPLGDLLYKEFNLSSKEYFNHEIKINKKLW